MDVVMMEIKPNPHLKKVLKSYQLSAANTLNGPSTIFSRRNMFSNMNGGGVNDGSGNGLTSTTTSSCGSGSSSSRESTLSPPLPLRPSSGASTKTTRSLSMPNDISSIMSSKINSCGAATAGGGHRNGEIEVVNGKARSVFLNDRTINYLSSRIKLDPCLVKASESSGYLPLLSAAAAEISSIDQNRDEVYLEGELITCFSVGGERRLVIPQVLNHSRLRSFNLSAINQVCDELQIFCSRCSTGQLEILKASNSIPASANSCGLIRISDAERLVSRLISSPKAVISPASNNFSSSKSKSILVHHKCFGKCKGIVYPDLYTKPDALCIECHECHGLFSTFRFVSHSHRNQENRTCHWGFDTKNWRKYLRLVKSGNEAETDKAMAAYEEVKSRFDHKRKEPAVTSITPSLSIIKSISAGDLDGSNEDGQKALKKLRYSDESSNSYFPTATALTANKPYLQYSKNIDQSKKAGLDSGDLDLEKIQELMTDRLSPEISSQISKIFDKMANKIANLEMICHKQEKIIDDLTHSQQQNVRRNNGGNTNSIETKVHPIESELHFPKKQLLRRIHEQT